MIQNYKHLVISQYSYNKQITSWLVRLYDFYSLVVKNRKLTRSKTRSFVCDSSQLVNKNRTASPTMKQSICLYIFVYILNRFAANWINFFLILKKETFLTFTVISVKMQVPVIIGLVEHKG